jgi:hypothetical protein
MSKRWEPVGRAIDVVNDLLVVSVNFLTPSTQTSMRANVPVIVEAACTVTGELTVEPLTGEQTFTPAELGALHDGVIVNVRATDATFPGFRTDTCAVPGLWMSAAEMAADNCVALTNVVARLLPFHRTVEPATKFEPFTVSVICGPPAVVLEGAIDVIAGTGLLAEGGPSRIIFAMEGTPFASTNSM